MIANEANEARGKTIRRADLSLSSRFVRLSTIVING